MRSKIGGAEGTDREGAPLEWAAEETRKRTGPGNSQNGLVGKGNPNDVGLPSTEGVPVPTSGDVPVVGVLPSVETGADRLGIATRGVNVIRGADGLGVRRLGRGLRPPTPSSVEPIGIPTLPTDDTAPIPVEADAAGPAKELPVLAAQAPDALPAIPPPSKVARLDAPVIELPMPEGSPADEAPAPKDACGNDPPMPPHVETVLVEGAMGDVPDIIGLTPGAASSVAPMGILAGATGEPGPTPSGDVMPSEGPGEMLIPPTCA